VAADPARQGARTAPCGIGCDGRLGDIQLKIPALGTVTPLATVTVRTQISG